MVSRRSPSSESRQVTDGMLATRADRVRTQSGGNGSWASRAERLIVGAGFTRSRWYRARVDLDAPSLWARRQPCGSSAIAMSAFGGDGSSSLGRRRGRGFGWRQNCQWTDGDQAAGNRKLVALQVCDRVLWRDNYHIIARVLDSVGNNGG
jgi:hypothetical protein